MIKGKTLYHCHGKDKGKKIMTYSSRKKALSAHRAIMAQEHNSPLKMNVRAEKHSSGWM